MWESRMAGVTAASCMSREGCNALSAFEGGTCKGKGAKMCALGLGGECWM
ncbi:hypothetical protein AA106556_0661 [Neokomagataea tanensis NBRC 106556]|uniref:Uncharacterized protein n=1 Tax=Neokomagataea tanensis NBRC 106556 TaxID=1223519 RepID=A0ABQ0QHL3_9PROT|nr:hypothetical protein AA106556_0661 [Neokomagataea tanensis NBRC 106556]